MTSAIEISKKIASAVVFNKADIDKIVDNYMRELLIDMGQRYGMTEITHHMLAAAFKIRAEVLYSWLDDDGKRACDDLVEAADFGVQQISMPIEVEIKKED